MAIVHRQIQAFKDVNKMKNKDISAQLLKETIQALTGLLKHPKFGKDIPLREIRVHCLDDEGDGIGLWVEFNEETEEFEKGMISIAADDMTLPDIEEEDAWENRTLGNNEFLN